MTNRVARGAGAGILFLSMVLGPAGAQGDSPAAGAEPPWSRPPAWARAEQGGYFAPGYERAVRATRNTAVSTPAPALEPVAPPPFVAWDARPGPSVSAMPSVTSARASAPSGPPETEADRAEPLWEIGLIGGVGVFPDWPAAEDSGVHGMVLPTVVYRGEILRAGEKGLLRGRLIHTRDLELDISLDGSFPVDSDAGGIRSGMPDLDWMGEVGPRLQWTVARAAHSAKIDLELPVRAVFATDFHSRFDHVGWVSEPEIAWQHANFLDSGAAVKLGVGPVFGDEGVNDEFYEVAPAYARAGRPAYDAEAGYMGSKAALSAALPVTPWVTVMGRLRGDFHSGAANDDSPLFQEDVTYSAGLAVAVTLAKSKARATGHDQ